MPPSFKGTFYFDDVRFVADANAAQATAVLDDGTITVPESFALGQNYPNPLNSSTQIPYELADRGEVLLSVHNLLGQSVRTLVGEAQEADLYAVRWDGRDDSGRALASGVYVYRLRVGDKIATRRLLLLR